MDDIWAEIDAIYGFPNREEGDIDSGQIAKRYGIGESAAQRRMHRLVDSGEYEFVTVRDNASSNGRRLVIRRTK